jgi:hypothetical protein
MAPRDRALYEMWTRAFNVWHPPDSLPIYLAPKSQALNTQALDMPLSFPSDLVRLVLTTPF